MEIEGKDYEVKIISSNNQEIQAEVNGTNRVVKIKDIQTIISKEITKTTQAFKAAAPKEIKIAPSSSTTIKGNAVTAPIPGQIKGLFVKEGDKINLGEKILVMEAMKMENIITSNSTGIISKILVGDGDNVSQDQQLVIIG